ncbi:MAG TPA: acyl carrier protein [Candidatus Limnocylindrales bacterium]|nr:acyl carrier protein [Candidatus Limnocylindrales bacterium]
MDTQKIWSLDEVRAAVEKILVESLAVDEAAVVDDASLVRDLGAESIDLLDISFKSQQTFGVDLPARLIQDRIIEWRSLGVLANVVRDRYGLSIPSDELRTVAPSTGAAVLEHLRDKHGVAVSEGEEETLATALAQRLLDEMDGMGLDLTDLAAERLTPHLIENLHSPTVMDEVLNRFTVRALADYIAGRLAKASRLAPGA